MASPVSSSSTVPAQTSTASSNATASPSGVGSQPTSIASAASSGENSIDYWETVKEYAGSFTEFIRKLVVSALEGLRSGLGVVVEWIGSTAADTQDAATNWQVPADTQPTAPAQAQDLFTALSITDVDRRKIFTIIHTMGGSWWTLISKRSEIEQYGKEIQDVHPLKFIEYIFKHPLLPKDMDAIAKSSLTMKPFMEGLAEKMRREAATLPVHKTGFARSLNVSLADIDPYFNSPNWEGMVKFLTDVKLGRKNSAFVEPAPPSGSTTTAAPPDATTTAPSGPTTTAPSESTTTASDTTTTDAGITLTPTQVLRIADLPFDSDDNDILTALVTQYAQNRRLWLLWNQNSLDLQWDHLGARHPLKLLVYLNSKPALMTHLHTISQYWVTKGMFMGALTYQLARLPLVQVRPYMDDFAQICQLDPNRTKTLIQNGNWGQIVEDLIQSHQARAPT